MPRPKRPAHLRYMRDSFSGPAYIVAAARLAAGVPDKEFAPWLVAAMRAKLERENPGLLEKTHDALAAGDQYIHIELKVADPNTAPVANSKEEVAPLDPKKVAAVAGLFGPTPEEMARKALADKRREYPERKRRRVGARGSAKGKPQRG